MVTSSSNIEEVEVDVDVIVFFGKRLSLSVCVELAFALKSPKRGKSTGCVPTLERVCEEREKESPQEAGRGGKRV
jgi:hypothetical protein